VQIYISKEEFDSYGDEDTNLYDDFVQKLEEVRDIRENLKD